jgi:hypothetical protein
MTRKLLKTGIALVGIALALGSNAWAEQGRGGKDHRNDKGYHYNAKSPSGHHYGWEKGRGNPHRDDYRHRPEYRHRDRHPHRDYHPRKRVVEKHVYHHYSSDDRYDDDRVNVAVSVIDQFFSVAVAVSGTR